MMRSVLLLSLFLPACVFAQVGEMMRDPGIEPGPRVKPPAGVPDAETVVILPDLPREEDLIAIGGLPRHAAGRRLYLDRRALSLGEDRIVRYTAIVESSRGLRNIFYEGIDCSRMQVRRYAVAIGDGPFTAYNDNRWRGVSEGPTIGLHDHLARRVVCDRFARPRNPREIVNAARDDSYREPELEFH